MWSQIDIRKRITDPTAGDIELGTNKEELGVGDLEGVMQCNVLHAEEVLAIWKASRDLEVDFGVVYKL
ncbi:hypothetical protein TWF506_009332 [Arthrobotrys conoides]|uniref:Uncharacterized protein n=1 Tax=Arthrobotrys conoides TaxID=74498 RepID=A0AAN8NME2_9PEZI